MPDGGGLSHIAGQARISAGGRRRHGPVELDLAAARLPYPLQELHCAGVGVEVLSSGKLYLQSSKAGKASLPEDQSPRTQASSGLVGNFERAVAHGAHGVQDLQDAVRSITRTPACLSPRSQVLAASGHFPGAVHGDLRLENLLVDRGLTHVVAVDFERGIEGVDRYPLYMNQADVQWLPQPAAFAHDVLGINQKLHPKIVLDIGVTSVSLDKSADPGQRPDGNSKAPA
ncbi:hypothetical protein SELMODRAFT_410053 [Selaginella moellendorffii]|uniref:Protein kinase domain-containing protein n=1 Tax=Selaginella moellendorffii TaxID=88036 RepID=D8RDB7_SELML|nr:hypothetical protein SELMODRAFT_410053 [Selaginella moellendorffii]